MRVFKKIENGKKSELWWIDYKVNGRRFRKPISKRKEEAEKVLNQIRSKILQRKYQLPNEEEINFSDFAMKYIKEHSVPTKAKKSVETDLVLLKNLISYFGKFNLDEINDYHFEQYRNLRLTQKVKGRNRMTSTTTINREGALLRAILNKAVQWDYLPFNPIKKMSMFRELPKENIIPLSEIGKLIANADGYLKHIILIAFNTGMRRGEILKLKTSSINIKEGFLTVTAETSKTRRSRDIALNNSMIELFTKLMPTRVDQEYFFQNPLTNKPYTDIKTAWYSLLKKTGIKNFRFHDIRHCFATYGVLNGGDLISLKETLGHTRITTTERYSKALMEGKRKLVKGFDIPDTDHNIIELETKKSV